MADSKITSSTKVEEPVQAEVSVETELKSPGVHKGGLGSVIEDNMVIPDGQNLYFFPDIQKSTVASGIDEAISAVQTELDAFKAEEGNQ